MVAPLPVTATSRSVALRLEPGTDLQAGSLLNLTASPESSATARTISGLQPTGAAATSRGLGAGYSRYYAGLADEAFFQSPNLSINSGGGSVTGNALATAYATGRADTDASALATNVGLANVSYLDRYGGALRIGSSDNPFSARAVVGTGSVLGPVAGSSTTLNASAIVRGLEGSGTAATEPIRSGNSLTANNLAGLRKPDQPLAAAPIAYGPNGEALLDLRGGGGLVQADLLLFRDTSEPGSISFYRVLDAAGTVRASDGRLLRPADAGYAAAALAPSNRVTELSNLQLDSPNSLVLQPDRLIDESGLLAPLLSTPGANGPEFRFAYASANPGGTSPFRTYRDGGSSTIPTAAAFGARQQAPANADVALALGSGGSPYLNLSSSAGLVGTNAEISRDALFNNRLGFYRILDAQGSVRASDGTVLRPGDSGYLAAALRPGNLATELQGFALPTTGTGTKSLLIDEVGLLAPFVQSTPPTGNVTRTFFSFPVLNPDGREHFRLSPDGKTLLLEDFSLRAQAGGTGEPDYDDLTIGFSPVKPISLPIFDYSGTDRPVFTQFSTTTGSNGDRIGFYRLADASGAVRREDGTLVLPGDPAYRAVALSPANLVTSLDGQTYSLTNEAGLIAPFLKPASPTGGPERFPYPSANPDGTTPFTVTGLNQFSADSQQVALGLLRRLPSASYGDQQRQVGFEDISSRTLALFDFRNSDGPYRTELSLSQPPGDPARTFGFYRVLDTDGTVRAIDGSLLRPGDAGYLSAALRPENLVTELANLRVPAGRTSVAIPVEIDERSILAPYVVSTTTDGGTLTLVPWPSANPSGQTFPIQVPVGAIASVQATSPRPEHTFYGQPNAVVRADAELNAVSEASRVDANLRADAAGLESYTVKVVPFGNGDGTASVKGTAIANLRADGLQTLRSNDSLRLDGRAVGIDNSQIYGAPTLNTTVEGIGLAINHAVLPGADLNRLQGIGILNSRIDTNQGNDVIRAFGGMSDGGLPIAAGRSPTSRDAAGFDGSTITTGLGDDAIFGRILNEVEAGIDHDQDGQLEDTVFLDRAALSDPARSGFDGIRHTSINTGIGNDVVGGSSSVSHVNGEIGNDVINLDRARYSSFWGGIGNDVLSSSGPALHNVFWGGIGNDRISTNSGDGNLLDGGLGQDVMTGGTGRDQFVVSDAAGALRAASSTTLRDELADTPLWSVLSQDQKETLWNTGQLLNNSGQVVGSADAIRNFEAGKDGDVLHLSDSLASITQELWDQKGAIYGVGSDGKLTVTEASADGSNKVGLIVGNLADIQKLGIGSPSLAYATDTRQLMFDADGIWSSGAQSLGSLSIGNGAALSRANFQFDSASGQAAGPAPTGQGGVL